MVAQTCQDLRFLSRSWNNRAAIAVAFRVAHSRCCLDVGRGDFHVT